MAANNKIVIHFLLLYRKDVRLPQQLQRAMAAEAEASREARAKVVIIYFFLRFIVRIWQCSLKSDYR